MPTEQRCTGLMPLIDSKQYFVIHAARQMGKTTLLQSLCLHFNQTGKYHAVYCSLEQLRTLTTVEEGIPAMLEKLEREIRYTPELKQMVFSQEIHQAKPSNALNMALTELAGKSTKPVVVFFDEADCLTENLLLSFLSQIRDGYVNRSRRPFIHSLALVGMRDLRDYKAKIRKDRNQLGGTSPFNVAVKSLTLRNFNREEVAELYGQHTADTGQVFEPAAVEMAFQKTQGQPWLVNAVARECVEEILQRDFSKPVTVVMVDQAIQTIILRRDTHIDNLLERLKEDRVKKIILPMILGEDQKFDSMDDDCRYVLDLGLVCLDKDGLKPANPIYAEVTIRTLGLLAQERMNAMELETPLSRYLGKNKKLDMTKLLKDFQTFWRENAEMMGDASQYREAVPHLVLQAYLQRILNGGGRISREFAVGRRRMDLLACLGKNRCPLEIKLWYGPKSLVEGLKQIGQYLEKVDEKEGWLVFFDRRPKIAWKRKLYWRKVRKEGRTIHVVGV